MQKVDKNVFYFIYRFTRYDKFAGRKCEMVTMLAVKMVGVCYRSGLTVGPTTPALWPSCPWWAMSWVWVTGEWWNPAGSLIFSLPYSNMNFLVSILCIGRLVGGTWRRAARHCVASTELLWHFNHTSECNVKPLSFYFDQNVHFIWELTFQIFWNWTRRPLKNCLSSDSCHTWSVENETYLMHPLTVCRHPSNLMLDRVSGKIIHIDFGDCFEVAMTREKFPEKIPFRLTRMLINAMEVCYEYLFGRVKEQRSRLLMLFTCLTHTCWHAHV